MAYLHFGIEVDNVMDYSYWNVLAYDPIDMVNEYKKLRNEVVSSSIYVDMWETLLLINENGE